MERKSSLSRQLQLIAEILMWSRWYIYFAAGPGGTDRQRALALKGNHDHSIMPSFFPKLTLHRWRKSMGFLLLRPPDA